MFLFWVPSYGNLSEKQRTSTTLELSSSFFFFREAVNSYQDS